MHAKIQRKSNILFYVSIFIYLFSFYFTFRMITKSIKPYSGESFKNLKDFFLLDTQLQNNFLANSFRKKKRT